MLNFSDFFNTHISIISLQLGDTLSKVIADMIAAGLNRDKLHLVGYSLGGQMVGRIGAGLKRRSSRKLVLRR